MKNEGRVLLSALFMSLRVEGRHKVAAAGDPLSTIVGIVGGKESAEPLAWPRHAPIFP